MLNTIWYDKKIFMKNSVITLGNYQPHDCKFDIREDT
jgi:hypothetical protein